MAGPYCRYCDHRCFVYREVITAHGRVMWAGHMATCPEGSKHDREILGVTHLEARNPYENR